MNQTTAAPPVFLAAQRAALSYCIGLALASGMVLGCQADVGHNAPNDPVTSSSEHTGAARATAADCQLPARAVEHDLSGVTDPRGADHPLAQRLASEKELANARQEVGAVQVYQSKDAVWIFADVNARVVNDAFGASPTSWTVPLESHVFVVSGEGMRSHHTSPAILLFNPNVTTIFMYRDDLYAIVSASATSPTELFRWETDRFSRAAEATRVSLMREIRSLERTSLLRSSARHDFTRLKAFPHTFSILHTADSDDHEVEVLVQRDAITV
ncbi:MAG TPA: hypothetical protein VML55_26875, partial [Planctomycetaceae bacterium]|nr:hypothetical protein [Planctomycetaceae bacterium]